MKNNELREKIAMVVASWQHDMTDGDWPQDAVRKGLDEINNEHSGDCKKQPWTCGRCVAEEAYKQTDQILEAIAPYLIPIEDEKAES